MKREIFILIAIWFFIGGRCPSEEELKWERNPNLELFLADISNTFHYFSPVWDSYNDRIYFIMKIYTSNAMESTHNDSFIIFSGYDDESPAPANAGFYMLNLHTRKESLLIDLGDSFYAYTFTLCPLTDSIIYTNKNRELIWFLIVNPANLNELFIVANWGGSEEAPTNEQEEIYKIHFTTWGKIALEAKPYYWTDIERVDVNSQGSMLIFSTTRPRVSADHLKFERMELWLLNLK